MRIALIGCTSKKRTNRSKAIDLYDPSAYFRKRVNYAKSVLKTDEIYILSAKHHLLCSDEFVDPYNECLKNKTLQEKKDWADTVFDEIESKINKDDEIYILAGKDYYKYLEPKLIGEGFNVINVLRGKGGIGSQMHWLEEGINNI